MPKIFHPLPYNQLSKASFSQFSLTHQFRLSAILLPVNYHPDEANHLCSWEYSRWQADAPIF